MSESAQLTRQWQILQRLEESRSGHTVQNLAEELEVSQKTIRRDLKVLQTLFNITEVTGDGGIKRWRMQPLSQQLSFNYTDLISIVMSRRFLEPLAGTPFWEGHHKVLRKVQGVLGSHAAHYCDQLHRLLQTSDFGAGDYTQRGQLIDELIVAMEERKRVLIAYQSMQSTEPTEQEIGPQGFVWHNGSLYLIAWSARRGEIRNYKVDRIEDVREGTDLQYVVPDDFSLEDWKQQAFGAYHGGERDNQEIRIWFHRDAARYVQESHWHASQIFEPQDDGSLVMELSLSDVTPVLKWVLSFGRRARVLEPADLVRRVQEEARRILEQYEIAAEASA